jgi:phospholipase C
MATRHSANVFVTNDTDGTVHIKLFHRNSSTGIQNGSWSVRPGATAGPLTVLFETSWNPFATHDDRWSVIIAVEGGSVPGIYANAGADDLPGWKDRRLRRADAGKDLTFSVSTTSFGISLASGGSSDTMTRLADFSKITNVFVLMLENHSFDNIFGQSGIPGIEHATSADSNSYNGVSYAAGGQAPATMPTDPGHEFTDVVEQLGGPGQTYSRGGPYPTVTGSGFAANYAVSTTEGPAPASGDIGKIMLGFDTAAQLPVLYQLATEFAVCDHWFSSLPGPTWPNRFFVHGASSAGLDHSPTKEEMVEWVGHLSGFTLPHGSLFEALSQAGLDWRVYCDDSDAYSDDPQNGSALGGIPQVSALRGISLLDAHSVTRLAEELQHPYACQYTFIEPNYGDLTTYEGGSSQHPMDDVFGGESLVKAVYEAIRNSPVWDTSLLVITYDEHGGFYDSVIPGAVTAPDDDSPATYSTWGFPFTQLGVRVPAVVVSPWVPAGTVDHTVYDHASIPATVERLFGFPPLTKRDEQASDLRALLTEEQPRTDAPATLHDPAPPAPRAPITAETRRARDAKPVPESGNLPGFLHILLKTDLEMSATPQDRDAALARYHAVSTHGDARAYIADVMARAGTARSARAQRRPA